jgi:hypothetical protein
MPKITFDPSAKGLFQSSGKIVVIQPRASQAIATGGTLETDGYLIPFTAAAAATGVLLTSGSVDGQTIILQNRGTKTVDFAAQISSGLSGSTGTDRTFVPGSTVTCVWDSSQSTPVWCPQGQTLS